MNKPTEIHLIFCYAEEKQDSYIDLAKYSVFPLEREIHSSFYSEMLFI